MSRSLRATAAVPFALALTLAAWPAPASAHALGDATYQLPVPLWLYLVGAAVAVGASFIVTSLIARQARGPRYPWRRVPPRTASVTRVVARNVGMAWWFGAIGVGFALGDSTFLPGVLLWIGIWVGLPIAAALIGNGWPSLSPFRTTFAGLEWVARRLGASRLDLGVPYPRWLARWPAVALLAAGVWIELVPPGSALGSTVALVMLAYTLLTLAGMVVFGQIAWLRNAELFEVELHWLGRIGPIGRRSLSSELCAGCGEACRVERCIDCPECSTAADDPEREPGLRPWIVGLGDVTRAGWSDAAFIVLLLAGVTYDGLRETALGAWLLDAVLPPLTDAFGITLVAFMLADTVAYGVVVGGFLVAFAVTRLITARLSQGRLAGAGVYASALLPIAAGYLIAHYLTYVIQGAIWLPALIVDPLMGVAPDLTWIPTATVWYLSVGAIVGGHIAGIVLAHGIALRDSTRRATLAGLPMVALMIGYTILSLWILAQPIVIDPGATPSAVR